MAKAAKTPASQIDADVAAMHERVRDGRYSGEATTQLTQLDENYNPVPFSGFIYAWMMYKANRNSNPPPEIEPRLHMLVGWTNAGNDIYAMVANNDNCQYCILETGRRTDVRRTIAGNEIQGWIGGLRNGEFVPRKGNTPSAILTTRGEIIKRALKEEAALQKKNGTAPSRDHNDQLQAPVVVGLQAGAAAVVALPAVAGPVAALNGTLPADYSMPAFTQAAVNTVADFNPSAANQADGTLPASFSLPAFTQADGNTAADSDPSAANPADGTLPNGFSMDANQGNVTIPVTNDAVLEDTTWSDRALALWDTTLADPTMSWNLPTASATLGNPQLDVSGPAFGNPDGTHLGDLNMDADSRVDSFDYTQFDNAQPNVTDPAALPCDGPLPDGAQLDSTELQVDSFDFTQFDNSQPNVTDPAALACDGPLRNGAQFDSTELLVMPSANTELGNLQFSSTELAALPCDGTLPYDRQPGSIELYVQPSADTELGNFQFALPEAKPFVYDSTLLDSLMTDSNPVDYIQPTVAEPELENPQFDLTEAIAAPFDGTLPDDLMPGINPVVNTQPTVDAPVVADWVPRTVVVQNDGIFDATIAPDDTYHFSSMFPEEDPLTYNPFDFSTA